MEFFESLSHTKWECKYHVVLSQAMGKTQYGGFAATLGGVSQACGAEGLPIKEGIRCRIMCT
jgi:hypothetical protein